MNQKGYITFALVYNVRLKNLCRLCYTSQSTQAYSDARTLTWMNQKGYTTSALVYNVRQLDRVNDELKRLCDEGIIRPVTHPTDWLSNILVKEKPNGKLLICIDPSQTINKAIRRPKYTIPAIEEKLPQLTKAKVFTILDVSEAFHTVVMDEESSLLTTFQGPNGRYCYTCIPFGIASGPEEYQRHQHEFLDGLHRVINIADDICVFGCGDSKEEADIDHDKNFKSLLGKCSNHDL